METINKVNVRYLVENVDTKVAFPTQNFGFTLLTNHAPAFASKVTKIKAQGLNFRNEIIKGPAGSKVLLLYRAGKFGPA